MFFFYIIIISFEPFIRINSIRIVHTFFIDIFILNISIILVISILAIIIFILIGIFYLIPVI